jgi:hypothetical protein
VPLTTNALERLVLTRLNSQPGLLLDYFSTLACLLVIGVKSTSPSIEGHRVDE